jgi:CBS domain-containing protein
VRIKDLMQRNVLTVQEEDSVEDLMDALVEQHIHGAPVVNDKGELIGVVSQLDIHLGATGRSRDGRQGGGRRSDAALKVRDIMTAPAVHATEETSVSDLCRMMHRLRIHRVPIVKDRKLTGVISSLDICAAVGRGERLD